MKSSGKIHFPCFFSGRWRSIAALAALLLAASGCEVGEDGLSAIDDAFGLNPDSGVVAPPVVGPGCTYDRFQQPEAEITRKIDLLFMVDTSGSLAEEHQAIADGVDAFLTALPAEVDVNIGVMLAHGSTSSRTGKLWKRGTEPLVLKSSELTNVELKQHLQYKMGSMAADNGTDGGEESFYSMSRALDSDRLSVSQTEGFFRPDAALAVVFVADENDICAVYPSNVTPVVDVNGIEPVAYDRDCAGITAEGVLAKIRAHQGENPLLIAGVIYNNHNTYPKVGENEYGYGYADILRLSSGLSIDLASGDYTDGLADIATLAIVKMNLQTEFALSQTNVDPATVQVWVDGAATPFSYIASTVSVNVSNPGTAGSFVDVSYCEMPPAAPEKVSNACAAGSFSPKSTIKLGLSIDPDEGSMNATIAGFQAMGWNPTVYTDAQIAAGDPIADGVTVLVISRKVVLAPVDAAYVSGLNDYVASGGSLIGEYDGAALFFDEFVGTIGPMVHMDPSFGLYSAKVSGGGVLLPLPNSTTYVTNSQHPIMQGVPSSFLISLKAAFAIENHNAEWLEPAASYVSSGFNGQVPEGTYPAVLAGRCGEGRVALFTMTHFGNISQAPVSTMISNAVHWAVGDY